MWTSYPIFSGAIIKMTLDILQFAYMPEKSSYGVLTALESGQAVTSNAWRQSCTGSRLLVGGAGGGTIHCTAACRSETLRSYATKPGHGPGTTNQPVENILHNFGALSVAFVTHCIKITVSSATICHSATSLPRPNFDMCEIDAAVLGCHRVRTLSVS